MKVRAVSFDCADTMVAVDWRPSDWALLFAEELGLECNRETAKASYDILLHERWREFQEVNLTRSQAQADAFWERITKDWCREVGWPQTHVPELLAVADRMMFGPETKLFTMFDDVLPCLERLQCEGYRMVVVSNWDMTLHRVLRTFGLTRYFEFVLASMEEGVEKPDPRLFHIALERLGLAPEEVAHVGDNPLDDLQGARAVGIKAFLVDRSRQDSVGPLLKGLYDLPEALAR